MSPSKLSLKELLLGGPNLDQARDKMEQLMRKEMERGGSLKASDRNKLKQTRAILRRSTAARVAALLLGAAAVRGGAAMLPQGNNPAQQAEKKEHDMVPLPDINILSGGYKIVIAMPKELALEPEEIKRIAHVFREKFVDGYNQRFVASTDFLNTQDSISEWVWEMFRELMLMDERIAAFVAKHPDEFPKDKPETVGTLINSFLVRGNMFWFVGSPWINRISAEPFAIEGQKAAQIIFNGKTVNVPIILLATSTLPEGHPLRLNEGGAMTDSVMKVVLAWEEKLTSDAEERLKEIEEDSGLLALFEKEHTMTGNPKSFVEEEVASVYLHESVHVLLDTLFPRWGDIFFPKEKRLVDFGKMGKAKPHEVHELAANGVELAQVKNHGPLRAFYTLHTAQRVGRYELAGRYLLWNIIKLQGFNPEVAGKIQTAFSKGGWRKLTTDDLIEACLDPAVTTEKVAEIGRKMWSYGYRMYEKGEEYANRK